MSERTPTELGEVVSARASFTTLTVLAAASVALFAVTLFALVEYQRRTASALATWSLRLDDIAELGRLVGEVAAPGNDAIDSAITLKRSSTCSNRTFVSFFSCETSTLSSATSLRVSAPTTVAGAVNWSPKATSIFSAPSTTW